MSEELKASTTPIENALWPLRYAWWKINLDPGGWADIDIFLDCETTGCKQTYSDNCGCVITESTKVSILGIDDMIARAVKRYLADPRSEENRKNFEGDEAGA
jgi:hypothetical protein